MKIKFEIKTRPTSVPEFTIFMENKPLENVFFTITRFNMRNMKIGESDNNIVEKQDLPISDGILTMDKVHLKKFIEALKCLLKG